MVGVELVVPFGLVESLLQAEVGVVHAFSVPFSVFVEDEWLFGGDVSVDHVQVDARVGFREDDVAVAPEIIFRHWDQVICGQELTVNAINAESCDFQHVFLGEVVQGQNKVLVVYFLGGLTRRSLLIRGRMESKRGISFYAETCRQHQRKTHLNQQIAGIL